MAISWHQSGPQGERPITLNTTITQSSHHGGGGGASAFCALQDNLLCIMQCFSTVRLTKTRLAVFVTVFQADGGIFSLI
jgi:hypothetical protein